MLARRLLLLIAVLLAISLVTIGINPSPPRPSVTPIVPQPPVGEPTPAAATVEASIDAAAPRARTVAVDEGDEVQLSVAADDLDSVEIEGLDLLAAVTPDSPAQFDILADAPGDYPIVLADSGRTVGTLHVIAPES